MQHQRSLALRIKLTQPKPRIGIYAGAFDPVHAGHIAFALQAMQVARLDEVVFVPERRPRHKPGVEHYAHRVAMLRRALRPHPGLASLEMVDKHFLVVRTLPHLRAIFPKAELVFLMGSDTALSLPTWPAAAYLLRSSELVVGVRSEHDPSAVEAAIRDWPELPLALTVIDSYAPDVSSSAIRTALRANRHAKGLLTSVQRYAQQEWLYVSPLMPRSHQSQPSL